MGDPTSPVSQSLRVRMYFITAKRIGLHTDTRTTRGNASKESQPVQIQWIQVVSAPGPDTVDTYRTTRIRYRTGRHEEAQ